MNVQEILEDSYRYSKGALWGKWGRWFALSLLHLLNLSSIVGLVFLATILFPGPAPLLSSEESNLLATTGIGWGLFAVLLVGLVVSGIALTGYSVRICRGLPMAPDFAPWGELLVAGLKAEIVSFLWFLPGLVLYVAGLMVLVSGSGLISEPSTSAHQVLAIALFLTALCLLVLGFIATVFVSFHVPLGIVRFARTGSIHEGLRFGVINKQIKNIGWKVYIGSLVMLCLVWCTVLAVFAALDHGPAGWITMITLPPLWTVFSARFITHLYDRSIKEPVPIESHYF